MYTGPLKGLCTFGEVKSSIKHPDSIERKAATANLELLDIELPYEGLLTSMVSFTKGNKKKKSTTYAVICDQTGAVGQQVKITFNKEIKKVIS